MHSIQSNTFKTRSFQDSSQKSTMKLLVVEDHPVYLEGLSFVLNKLSQNVKLTCVNTLHKAQDVLINNIDFDLILLDLSLPDNSGLLLLNHLKTHHLFIPVAVLSASEERCDIQASLAAGASGFISKGSRSDELLSAIHRILDGEIYLPSFYSEQSHPIEKSLPSLTPRQKEVLALLAEGLPNKRICQRLHLTEHTVKSHLKSLFVILEVHTRTECAKMASELGLLSEEL